MKVSYDPEADVVCFRLSTEPIDESDELRPGVIVSFDAGGNVVALEILRASIHIPDPRKIEFALLVPDRAKTVRAA